MSKADLYTTLKAGNTTTQTIASDLETLEQNLANEAITSEEFNISVTQIRDIDINNLLVGDDLSQADVISLCDILLGNG
jgi:hypothetical protein